MMPTIFHRSLLIVFKESFKVEELGVLHVTCAGGHGGEGTVAE